MTSCAAVDDDTPQDAEASADEQDAAEVGVIPAEIVQFGEGQRAWQREGMSDNQCPRGGAARRSCAPA